jgi:phosphotriesterase-related protein
LTVYQEVVMQVYSVLGPLASTELGQTLIHEHILVDFIGASRISRERYSRREAYETMLPYLVRLKEQGIATLVECTPKYLGRDPFLLKDLSRASGIHLLTNTGLYAAGERDGELEPYLPSYAFELNSELLAGGWLQEWYEGIEGTEVRPAFLKIGVNRGELRPVSERIVRAAAIVSRQTGLVVACHTVEGRGALRILELFEEEKVAPDRFIFVHAQGEENRGLHLECAKRGAWIEYDGISRDSAVKHLDLILFMLENGCEDRLLISQDSGWYRPGEPGGGNIRGFEYLKSDFVPIMLGKGVPQATVDHLLIHNPRRALELSV